MNKVTAEASQFLPLVANGAIGAPHVGEGRIIPVLIVDCSRRKDVQDLISIHEHTPPGDVVSVWAFKRFDSKHIYLKLDFSRPMAISVYIPFTLAKHADLVNGIMRSKGCYLQPLTSGVKVSEGLDKAKILIEVSAQLDSWPGIYEKQVSSLYRTSGISRKESKILAAEHLARMNEIWTARFRRKK